MAGFLKSVTSGVLAAMVGLAPVAGFAADPIGLFQTEDRKMDYQASYCGADGTALCIELVKLRADANTKKLRKFLHKPLVDAIAASGENRWHGTITLLGVTADGDVTLTPGKSLYLRGCAYLVVCKDITLLAAKPKG